MNSRIIRRTGRGERPSVFVSSSGGLHLRHTRNVRRPSGTLRRATTEDVEAVLTIDRATPIGPERSDLLTERVRSGDVVIYEMGDHVLAYATMRPRSFFGRDFVELLAVVEDMRRQGVGTSLLEEMVRVSSTDRIFTSTNDSNAPMLGLLQKSGWEFSGRLDGIDADDPELVFFKTSA